jgi:hypothetical protein
MIELEKELDKEYTNYCNRIEAIAARWFEKMIKPYLMKNRYHFLAGNGTWLITKEKDGRVLHYLYTEDISTRIAEILNTPIPGMGQDLGSYMPDFHPEKD